MTAPQVGAEDELVSVIVPAYNAARYVRSALESVLAQTYPRLEIIVVDDGSRDDTAAVVAGLAAMDHRVQLLRQSNAGVAAARNAAIAQAKGTLIAPLDADDVWHPEKIARQVAALRRRGPSVGLVYAWSSTIDEVGRVIIRWACTARHEGEVYVRLILDNFVGPASTPLIRRTSLAHVGGYDTSLSARVGPGCEDYQLNLAIAERHAFAVVPEFLVGYRQTTSAMSQHVSGMKRSYDLVMAEVRCRHPELPAWLFRWSEGNFCLYLGSKCLLGGHPWRGLTLLSRALRGDWAFALRPKVRHVLRQALRRYRPGVGRRRPSGHPFLALAPGPTTADSLSIGRREQRRQRVVAALQLDRPEGA